MILSFSIINQGPIVGYEIKTYVSDELRPTPVLSFMIRHLGCISGVMVTASHNPAEYNGYKLYWDDGCQIKAPVDEEVMKEINNIDISKSDALKHIAELIEKKVFYVWRDENNKIVCTAVLKTNLQFARINHVYTPVEERCKGYAKNLIYVLTNKALDEGFIPVLYTDYNYPASNKAYKAVGYEDVGVLINFSCQNL